MDAETNFIEKYNNSGKKIYNLPLLLEHYLSDLDKELDLVKPKLTPTEKSQLYHNKITLLCRNNIMPSTHLLQILHTKLILSGGVNKDKSFDEYKSWWKTSLGKILGNALQAQCKRIGVKLNITYTI